MNQHKLLFCFLLGVTVINLALNLSPNLSINGDNAHYYILGQSLASGQGYTQIYHPDTPKETQYPPMFPAMIASIVTLGGGTMAVKFMVGMLFVLIPIMLLYWVGAKSTYWSENCGYQLYWSNMDFKPIAFALYMCICMNYVLIEFSGLIMSEIPFLFLICLALLYRSRLGTDGMFSKTVCVLLCVLPLTCRTTGIAFSIAVAVDDWWNGHRKMAIAHIGAMLLFMFTYRLCVGSGSPYIAQLASSSVYSTESGSLGFWGILCRIWANLKLYCWHIIPKSLTGELRGPVQRIIVMVLLVWGTFFSITALKRARTAGMFILFYMAILMVWPEYWSSRRFLAPVIPFMHLMIMAGIYVPFACFDGYHHLKKVAILQLIAWVSVCTMGNVERFIVDPVEVKRYSPDWTNYFAAGEWIEKNTPRDAVVVCRKPELMYLASQRQSFVYKFSPKKEDVFQDIVDMGATHVVLDQFRWTGTTPRYLWPAMEANKEKFYLLHIVENPPTAILGVKR